MQHVVPAIAKRHKEIARSYFLLLCQGNKEMFLWAPPLKSVSLGWQRDKATFLWGGGLSSLDKGPRVRCLHTRSLEASKVILKAQRFCKFWSTLGFGGCRHANLITVSFKWEPPGAANFVKKAHWALVVTDTGTWYQYFIIENPQVLRILGKSYLGVWWLQTRSLDITIF